MMATELDPCVFKAYDIRGIYREQLTEAGFRLLGKALAKVYPECRRIAVGYDGRLSSPSLAAELCRGLLEAGVAVCEIGQEPTPCLYFAAKKLCDGNGLMVTGSHNPKEYNGIKMMIDGKTLSGPSIQRLRKACQWVDNKVANSGVREALRISPSYLDECLSRMCVGGNMRIAIDAGNGVAGPLSVELFSRLGCHVEPLYCDVDGNFPNHHPNPGDPTTLRALQDCVRERKLDFGLAFDGDGDRLGLVDENGNIIRSDYLAMIFAKNVLKDRPGATIVYDVQSSRHLRNFVSALGGIPRLCRTGHSFVKEALRETGALFAGEMSGHFFFHDRWFGFDDALYAGARFQQILLSESGNCSELFAELPKTFFTPEINIHFSEEGEQHRFASQFIAENTFPNAQLCTIDGLRVEFNDGWGLLRASNTTPSLVMRFEADTEAALEQIQDRFRKALRKVSATLNVPF